MKRKLTTIFCADVQNYGALMSADETGTMARLKRYREIMQDHFENHQGRKVNTWGDAVIGEFTSVVEAVRCAVEIQDAITAENQDLPKNQQMWLRIGINLGDVMEDNGDIYGDGVNVAARLESLAEPGGIMVSESVYNFTHKQLAIGFDFAGKRQVKDGDEPIAGYRVRLGGSNQPSVEVDQSADENLETEYRASIAQTPKSGNKVDQAVFWLLKRYGAFKQWFPNQPKSVRVSVFMIGFFLAINVLFSGIATPWFIFPSAPFLLHIILKSRKKDKG